VSIAHYYPPTMKLADGLRRFTIDEYHRMGEAGILDPEEQVELVDGLVYKLHSASLLPRRFTIDEYYRMAEAGILKPDERVELIDGVVYTMSPIGSRHAACVRTLDDLFHATFRGRAIVSVQNPIRLPDLTEPQPDLVLARPHPDRYRKRHPEPRDILLLVEVMDTSAMRDRGQKLTAYATAAVPEVWLVDLDGQAIEVHHIPQGGVYSRSYTRRSGESVTPGAFPDVALNVDDILG
jgi:Uma2 family endonuclease